MSLTDFSNQEYHKEILRGLISIPSPSYPGNIIVAGNSQAILTCGNSSSQVIIAATKYGSGRIINCAHSFYNECLESGASKEHKQLLIGIYITFTPYNTPE